MRVLPVRWRCARPALCTECGARYSGARGAGPEEESDAAPPAVIPRVHGTINMLIEVHAWIRSHLPYWDRNGGRDHIVVSGPRACGTGGSDVAWRRPGVMSAAYAGSSDYPTLLCPASPSLLQLQTHDEGSCWLPAVLRPAIMLAHWGRMDARHVSNTGYFPDNYTYEAS